MVIMLFLMKGAAMQSQNPLKCGSEDWTYFSVGIRDSLNMLLDNFIELQLESELNSRGSTLFTLPVVFHIIYPEGGDTISDLRIKQQLERLNEDFGGKNPDTIAIPDLFKSVKGSPSMAFCLAQIGPEGQSTTGINRVSTSIDLLGLRTSNGRRHVFYRDLGGIDIWDPDRYINIYICDMGDIGGFAPRPITNPPKSEDGILLNFRFVGINDSESFGMGRIGTHEMGHYFNLDHPWGSSIDCQSDDSVKDTPRQFGPYFGCSMDVAESCGSKDMVHNFMDFVDDDCMYFFTKGQVSRMIATLILFRKGLLRDLPCTTEPLMDTIGLRVFPNPVIHDRLFVHLEEPYSSHRIKSIQLYQSNGVMLKQISMSQQDFKGWYSFDLTNVAAGVYLLSILTDQKRITKKIVKMY
jgi:hypothetical protein